MLHSAAKSGCDTRNKYLHGLEMKVHGPLPRLFFFAQVLLVGPDTLVVGARSQLKRRQAAIEADWQRRANSGNFTEWVTQL